MATPVIVRADLKEVFFTYLDLWEKKNKQYGGTCDRLFDEFGDVYFDIMLQQKLNRIKELANTESTFESKMDSLIDLMGYTAMYIVKARQVSNQQLTKDIPDWNRIESKPTNKFEESEEVSRLKVIYAITDWTGREHKQCMFKQMIDMMEYVDESFDKMKPEEVIDYLVKIARLRELVVKNL